MDKDYKKIDLYIIAFILSNFILISLIYLNLNTLNLIDYIMMGLSFILMALTYTTGIIQGIIFTALVIFVYASYIIYKSMTGTAAMPVTTYIWMIFMPLSVVIIGNIHENISELHKKLNKLNLEFEELVTIDETTGLDNIKVFYSDLDKEISLFKRHKIDFTLMLINILYYDELLVILNRDGMLLLMKELSLAIERWTRNEDKRYLLNKNMFAIIMPHTNIAGSRFVKERIKESIKDLDLDIKQNSKAVNIEIKIADVQYNDDIKNAIEFKNLVEKELEYDI